MIHTKIAETKAAVAFLVFVPVNQMQDENASTIDISVETCVGSGSRIMGEKQTMILADNGYYFAGFTVDSVAQFNCNEIIEFKCPYNTVSFIISTHVLILLEYIITPLHPYVQMITIALTVWLISW